MPHSVLARIDPSQIIDEPFPYVHSTEALEPAYYRELAEAYPSMERVVGARTPGNNRAYLLNAPEVLDDAAVPEIWRSFFAYHTSHAFFDEVFRFWQAVLEREYPDLGARFGKPLAEVTTGLRRRAGAKTEGNREADVMMDVQFGINSPVAAPTTVRGPHVDKRQKLYAGLLYFRLPEDDAAGGDLVLYRFRTPRAYHDGRMDFADRFVEPVRTIPYRPNSFIMWLNTSRSLHGVSPRQATPHHRRYVNFLGECYGLTTGGFFPLRRSFLGQAETTLRRLVGARDA